MKLVFDASFRRSQSHCQQSGAIACSRAIGLDLSIFSGSSKPIDIRGAGARAIAMKCDNSLSSVRSQAARRSPTGCCSVEGRESLNCARVHETTARVQSVTAPPTCTPGTARRLDRVHETRAGVEVGEAAPLWIARLPWLHLFDHVGGLLAGLRSIDHISWPVLLAVTVSNYAIFSFVTITSISIPFSSWSG